MVRPENFKIWEINIKATCEKLTANIVLNNEKLNIKNVPQRSGTKQGCLLSLFLLKHSNGSPNIAIRQEK